MSTLYNTGGHQTTTENEVHEYKTVKSHNHTNNGELYNNK